MVDERMKLLTVQEVAELLRVDVRTVYDHRLKLGGFYPAGIRVLRFRRDVIEQILEGPGRERFDALVSAPRKPRGRPFQKGAPARIKYKGFTRRGVQRDPHGLLDRSEEDRHGLQEKTARLLEAERKDGEDKE